MLGLFLLACWSLTFPNASAGYTCLDPPDVPRIPPDFHPQLSSPPCIFFTLFLPLAPKALTLHTSWGSHSIASAFPPFRPRWLLLPTNIAPI